MAMTEELFRADVDHVWHPFTQMADYATIDPLIIESAEGSWLTDVDGRRYLDGVSSLWCNVHGHRVPEIDAAIRAQLDRIAHSTLLGSANPPSIELARRLAQVTPDGLEHVFYAENGSSAVEIALKVAYRYWQLRGVTDRRLFVGFNHAYHGDTLGAVAVGGHELFHSAFRALLAPVLHAPSPYHYRCPDGHRSHEECGRNCLDALDKLLTENRGTVCAVILEPLVQGAAGMITQPPGFVAGVAELCREHDCLFILDEVATGFGRTGTMFACEQEGVSPDMLVMGKGLTGGYLPLSAMIATDEVYNAFLGSPTSGRTMYHGHTYTGNQLCCAAALANLDLFEKSRTLDIVRERALDLSAELEAVADLPHVGEVRQRGLMVGIELVADRTDKRLFPVEARVAWNACLALRREGILVRPLEDVVVLMPPLAISPADLRFLVRGVRRVLSGIRSEVAGAAG